MKSVLLVGYGSDEKSFLTALLRKKGFRVINEEAMGTRGAGLMPAREIDLIIVGSGNPADTDGAASAREERPCVPVLVMREINGEQSRELDRRIRLALSRKRGDDKFSRRGYRVA